MRVHAKERYRKRPFDEYTYSSFFPFDPIQEEKLECLDLFSGSGIVARFLKQHSSYLAVNDLENYSRIINSCYLSNKSEINIEELKILYDKLIEQTKADIASDADSGFISELYAPELEDDVKPGERCFYTPYNARYIDFMRRNIEEFVPHELKPFFIAPLLSQASIHANTAGIFKGFYKNSKTGLGQFGGNGKNAVADCNVALNTAVAESLRVFADRLEAADDSSFRTVSLFMKSFLTVFLIWFIWIRHIISILMVLIILC